MKKEIIAIGPILPLSFERAVLSALTERDSTYLIEELKILIKLEITGVIIYGSMAKCFNIHKAEQSDIDLLVLTNQEASGGIFGQAGNLEIDLHVQPRKSSIEDVAGNFVYSEGNRRNVE